MCVPLLHSFILHAEWSSAAIKHNYKHICVCIFYIFNQDFLSSANHIWPNPAAAPQLGLSGGQEWFFLHFQPENRTKKKKPNLGGGFVPAAAVSEARASLMIQSLEEDNKGSGGSSLQILLHQLR